MIDLYTWTTDNGFKARQMVEETGVEYTLKPVSLRKKEQFDPEFLKISPGHKIPAIVDHDGPGGVSRGENALGAAILGHGAGRQGDDGGGDQKRGNGAHGKAPLQMPAL